MQKNFKKGLAIISATFLALSADAFIKPNMVQAEFAHLCKNISGELRGNRYWMTAKCLDDNGDYNEYAEIDISEYVINRRSDLDWATMTERPGMFNLTCRNIHIDDNDHDNNHEGGILSADCENAQGTPIGTELNLNEKIWVDDDGEFLWVEDLGTSESSEPKPDICTTPQGPPGNPLGPNVCTKPI